MWSGGIVSRGSVRIYALFFKYCSLSYFQIVHLDTGNDPKSLKVIKSPPQILNIKKSIKTVFFATQEVYIKYKTEGQNFDSAGQMFILLLLFSVDSLLYYDFF